jgi:hypothetical protein
MDPKTDRTQHDRSPADAPRPTEAPSAPRKRFRIEKIEERVAPKKGGDSGTAQSSMSGTIANNSTSY